MKTLANAVAHKIQADFQTPPMTDLTARAFMSARVASKLARERLSPPEAVIFERYRQAYENRRVLDLGVGSGRTTGPLVNYARDYLGTDISPQMLAHAMKRHPSARFMVSDLRELGQLDEPPFDFILIAYNTIDVLTHDDRISFLRAVRDRLCPGGRFVFSTHNRAWTKAGMPPQLPRKTSRVGWPRYGWRFLKAMRALNNHHRLAQFQRSEDDYAIVTGSIHRSGLVYCIDREAQERQLASSGFKVESAYAIDGRELHAGDLAPDSYNLHFVCSVA
ncbi:methyltransferase domain-containing protein [Stappia sp. GBMRC 2046]|uniref:Methyltransferase domain-containing protein n=1 Tax=Stappia sediminis TaxID=2692190 RepID=A0A7X3LTQ6_9HYPH|nr:class I SAM-dependent methyltransferase [Stappia sediminis]MXN64870.1 methyltransferase domain-containing protein [Stappia sediminis]